jgi:UDP-N-acetylglucosamine 2-epimerase
LVLTSTSLNGLDLEKRFIGAARLQGIPSVSVLDFWSNYRPRFSSSGDLLDCVPDRIAVMDGQARDEMIAEGFESQRLFVTGQPAFDDLANWHAGFTPERRQTVRRKLGVQENELLVVFASQPYSAFASTDSSLPQYRGFDERSVAAQLLKTLEEMETDGRRITLVVRPHPRESADNFDHLRSDTVRVCVTSDGEARETVAAADLVVGMNTVLLIEACYLGCVVVSLQPGLKGADPLRTNRLGFSRAVYSDNQIAPAIRELLLDESSRRRVIENLEHFRVDGDAAKRVAELVLSLLPTNALFARS